MLIDRDAERRQLHDLLQTSLPQLALLTGRRRVGKTFLLTHVWENHPFFLFTAARTTPEINRRQLVQDLALWSGETLFPEDYPTWRTLFNLLLEVRAPAPLVVVLDEFQYLADDTDGLRAVASELNASWERPRPARPLLFVLSGSAVGTMEALAAGGEPLYGRFAWQHRILPFSYWHTAAMAPFPDLRDRALAYGILGGTPRYLAALQTSQTLTDNATRLMLDPTGEVRLLVETALDQEEGLRNASQYRAILRAITSGCTERNEIAQRTGLSNDAGLRDKLRRLIAFGYVETRQNIDARKNEAVRYGIADPAFRFHQRFVEPATSMLERYPADRVWSETVEPHLNTYMGAEFERIAVQAYDRRYETLGLPLVRKWGRWEGTDRDRLPLEIDLVARLADGGILTGAVKWNRTPIGAKVHWDHMEMLRRAAEAGQKWAHEGLQREAPLLYVAAGGFAEAFLEAVKKEPRSIICWTLDDLYAP